MANNEYSFYSGGNPGYSVVIASSFKDEASMTASSTDTVGIGEYALIDADDKDDIANGKLYLRTGEKTFDYKGKISGPAGESRQILIDNYDKIQSETVVELDGKNFIYSWGGKDEPATAKVLLKYLNNANTAANKDNLTTTLGIKIPEPHFNVNVTTNKGSENTGSLSSSNTDPFLFNLDLNVNVRDIQEATINEKTGELEILYNGATEPVSVGTAYKYQPLIFGLTVTHQDIKRNPDYDGSIINKDKELEYLNSQVSSGLGNNGNAAIVGDSDNPKNIYLYNPNAKKWVFLGNIASDSFGSKSAILLPKNNTETALLNLSMDGLWFKEDGNRVKHVGVKNDKGGFTEYALGEESVPGFYKDANNPYILTSDGSRYLCIGYGENNKNPSATFTVNIENNFFASFVISVKGDSKEISIFSLNNPNQFFTEICLIKEAIYNKTNMKYWLLALKLNTDSNLNGQSVRVCKIAGEKWYLADGNQWDMGSEISRFSLKEKLPEWAEKNHASTSNLYGVGSPSNYGHLKISDDYTSTDKNTALNLTGAKKMYKNLNTNFLYPSKEITDSWETISNNCLSGALHNYNIGDYKLITCTDGTKILMEIMGIDINPNIDTYDDGHHIDWISVHLMSDKHTFYGDDIPYLPGATIKNNLYSWDTANSDSLCYFLNTELYNKLPEDLKKYIVERHTFVNRCRNTGSGAINDKLCKSNLGYIWIPSENEIFGNSIVNVYEHTAQYPLFKNNIYKKIAKAEGYDNYPVSDEWGTRTTILKNNAYYNVALDESGYYQRVVEPVMTINFHYPICFRI